MCDGLEVGSYGCGTCSLSPVGFGEKMPHEQIIFGNFIIKFTGIVAILLSYTLKHLLYFKNLWKKVF
jgi:hypothetical protein